MHSNFSNCSSCGTPWPIDSRPRFCSRCGAVPEAKRKPARTRTCSPVAYTLNHDLAQPNSPSSTSDSHSLARGIGKRLLAKVPKEKSVAGYIRLLKENPETALVAGGVALTMGAGIIMAAGSVAALGTIVGLAGVTIIKVTAIGGVLAVVLSVNSDDQQAINAVMKAVGLGVLVGVGTVVVGGILGLISGLLILLGWILVAGGAAILIGLLIQQIGFWSQKRTQGRLTDLDGGQRAISDDGLFNLLLPKSPERGDGYSCN